MAVDNLTIDVEKAHKEVERIVNEECFDQRLVSFFLIIYVSKSLPQQLVRVINISLQCIISNVIFTINIKSIFPSSFYYINFFVMVTMYNLVINPLIQTIRPHQISLSI